MAFTRARGPAPQKGTLVYHQQQSASARMSLTVVIGITIINILRGLFSDSNTMYLFSAWMPLDIAYGVKEIYLLYDVFLTTSVVIGSLFLVLLILCAIFWKKSLVAPIAAAVLYLLDSLYVIPGLMETGPGFYVPSIGVAIFHVGVMILLITGVVNEAKARRLRKDAAPVGSAAEQAAKENSYQGPEL